MDRYTLATNKKMSARKRPEKAEQIFTQQEIMKLGLAQKKFEDTHILIGQIKTTSKRYPVLPVHQFIGWDYGKKYTGAKLRQIRRTHR